MMDMELLLPREADNLKLPDPGLLNYFEHADRRALWVDSEIDINLLEMTKKIMTWNAHDDMAGIPVEQRIPIKVYIFSPGGGLAETMHACSIMMMSKTPIYTVNMGMAMSGGFLLLISGHKRFALPYSRAMMHRGSGGAVGTYGQVEDAMKDYNDQAADMKNHILSRTLITAASYGKRKDRDWYMSADDQIKYGVVDKIVSNLSEIL